MGPVKHLAIDAVGAKHSGAAVVLLDTLEAALAADLDSVTVFTSPCSNAASSRSRAMAAYAGHVSRPTLLARRASGVSQGLASEARLRGCDALLCLSGGGQSRGRLRTGTLISRRCRSCPDALAKFRSAIGFGCARSRRDARLVRGCGRRIRPDRDDEGGNRVGVRAAAGENGRLPPARSQTAGSAWTIDCRPPPRGRRRRSAAAVCRQLVAIQEHRPHRQCDAEAA